MNLVQMAGSARRGQLNAVPHTNLAHPTAHQDGSRSGLAGWVVRLLARHGATRDERHLRVVETLSLGGRRQLLLVSCNGEQFLVAGGADSVDAIVPVSARPAANPEGPCS